MPHVLVQDLQLARSPQAGPRPAQHPLNALAPQLTAGGCNPLPYLPEKALLRWGARVISHRAAACATRAAHSGPRSPQAPRVTPPSTLGPTARAGSRSAQVPGVQLTCRIRSSRCRRPGHLQPQHQPGLVLPQDAPASRPRRPRPGRSG